MGYVLPSPPQMVVQLTSSVHRQISNKELVNHWGTCCIQSPSRSRAKNRIGLREPNFRSGNYAGTDTDDSSRIDQRTVRDVPVSTCRGS